tara:strand:+ start:211 stop:483 length:273 start_codon:yes stop_codon:yes gene_type:complete
MAIERRGYTPTRAQKLADHSALKIGTPALVTVLLGVTIFLLKDMHEDMKKGQEQINQNVTDIAVTRRDVENQQNWVRTLSERMRNYHNGS